MKKQSHGNLRRKFLALQVTAGAILLVIGIQGLLSMRMAENGRDSIEEFQTNALESKEALEDIRANILGYQLAAKDYLFAQNEEEKARQVTAVSRNSEAIENAFGVLSTTIKEDAFRQSSNNLKTSFKEYAAAIGTVLKMVDNDELFEAMEHLDSQVANCRGKLDTALAESVQFADDVMTRSLTRTSNTFAQLQQLLIVLGIVGIGAAFALIGLVTWFSHAINRQVGHIAEVLSSSSGALLSISDRLAHVSAEASHASSEQAASLEEASSSTEEQASTTRNNASNAQEAATMTRELSGAVTTSLSSMEELVSSMDRIANSGEETQKIIKTINEIAFQTNILALNAAVEAARAGDAGAGFAVVAEEVRNLAQRSSEAAVNSSQLIEASAGDIAHGKALATETHSSFSEAFKKTSEITDRVSSIANESHDQAIGIEQLSRTVHQMSTITQKGASSAEESAQSAKTLRQKAQNMRSAIEELSGMLGRGAPATATDFAATHAPSEVVDMSDEMDEFVAPPRSRGVSVIRH